MKISCKVTDEDIHTSVEDNYDGVYSQDGKLFLFLINLYLPYCVVREGAEVVCDHAFKDNKRLGAVRFPNSVTVIGSDIFKGCESLAIIYIPVGSREKFEQLLPEYRNLLVESECKSLQDSMTVHEWLDYCQEKGYNTEDVKALPRNNLVLKPSEQPLFYESQKDYDESTRNSLVKDIEEMALDYVVESNFIDADWIGVGVDLCVDWNFNPNDIFEFDIQWWAWLNWYIVEDGVTTKREHVSGTTGNGNSIIGKQCDALIDMLYCTELQIDIGENLGLFDEYVTKRN